MRTWAPAGDAPSWVGFLALLTPVPSLRLADAEEEKLLGGRRHVSGYYLTRSSCWRLKK